MPLSSNLVRDAVSVLRLHIVLVAMVAALVFGFIETGRYLWLVLPIVALDWFLINLMNRVTDVTEDRQNLIRGTEWVARHPIALERGCAVVVVLSLVVLYPFSPGLFPYRLAVHVIGLGYNYRIVPTPTGFSRWKEIYFLKNAMSAVLFVFTCFAYPAKLGHVRVFTPTVMVLVGFFFLFELSYEVLYDLRDLDGDRAAKIPTFPVVHGPDWALRWTGGLLIGAAVVLLVGALRGDIGLREGLMIVAPITQFLFYRFRLARHIGSADGALLSSADCIAITHLGTAQLVLFLVGTAVWTRCGLPENLFLR